MSMLKSDLNHSSTVGNVLYFYYGANGKPLSVLYNGETYYYVLNLQGDVVAILNSAGEQVVDTAMMHGEECLKLQAQRLRC